MKHRSNVNRRNTQALRPPSNAATHASRLYIGRCPPLPEDHYKVVYRPKTGMKLSNWADEKISEGIARACGYAFRDFCANVITQTQWRQNLIITSTGDEDYALKLAEVTSSGYQYQAGSGNSSWCRPWNHTGYDGRKTHGTASRE
ncbi:hypothetical protein MTO96_043696 [Rhipicephalus appendiculatus]